MAPRSGGIHEVRFHNSSERAESCQWSPTREQVDAYIRSLEWQMLPKDIGTEPRHAEERRVAGRGRGAFVFSRFALGLIALALGCFAWLVQTIYEGFK
jgi:hypothetical protein